MWQHRFGVESDVDGRFNPFAKPLHIVEVVHSFDMLLGQRAAMHDKLIQRCCFSGATRVPSLAQVAALIMAEQYEVIWMMMLMMVSGRGS